KDANIFEQILTRASFAFFSPLVNFLNIKVIPTFVIGKSIYFLKFLGFLLILYQNKYIKL
ncbi:MAG: hypothetical protein LJD31_02870, partial [Wolbachia endosymbiont of Menacanthus eurysternus]|nr:hypothetical protein [Wolbachia endosymbiont of Menacanthus eurysternus]